MNIAIPVLDRCTKLNLFRASRTIDMSPTASRVLQFLIDDATAPYWSLGRLAHAVGRQPRTVDHAIAELKQLGFLTVLHRRRQTSMKVLNVDAILTAISRAVCIAKEKARAAISMFRRAVQASPKTSEQYPSVLSIGAGSRFQGGPSVYLKRSMGLPVGPGRS